MPERKALIILTPGFPANEADTTCLPAQQLFVQNLQESFPGIDIIVLSFHYPYVRSTYAWKNVTVISFNGRNRGKLHRLMLWYKIWRSIKDIMRTQDVIGIFSFWCTECALIGQQFKLPHFIWILGQDAKKDNSYVKRIKPKSGQLVAMSDFLAGTFERNHGIRPQHIIPNGIDVRWYAKQKLPRTIDVLGVGSLIKLKRYDLFVELMAAIPGVKAVICGKGPEEQALRKQEHVALFGELPHPEVLKLMQQSKIFLHTSNYEGFSTVCLEALYAGAHVISFCEPVATQIPHWHIVRTKEEMLQKLLELLSKPLDHTPVMPYSMKDTAMAVMKLFSRSPSQ
ncbi:MAG TPA: glycosyltransferase family 4 protein [Chitinophagaceae bacterium]|nr:glycosyltransferase family 4 protein [Chitinophagaceae bacterium]